MTKKETIFVLLSITFCWSSSYIFIKDISQSFSAYSYLALTSGLAALGLAIAFHGLLHLINREILFKGLILSALIAGNIIFEKLALDHLSASAVSALASMNIILVPLILIIRKQFPTQNNIVGLLVIIAGLFISGYLSFQESGGIGIIYAFLSCMMMSLYTIFASDYTQESNPMLLTILLMGFTGLIGLVLSLVLEPGAFLSIRWDISCISYLIIITFFSKIYAYVMLMYSEKYADPVMITVIAATSPVITLCLALIVPDIIGSKEIFSFRSLLGTIIIAVGAIVAGTDFLSPKKEPLPEMNSLPGNEIAAPEAVGHSSRKTVKHPALKAFLSVLIIFTTLIVTIDVMEFANSYSKLRPANFIPIAAGLLFGPYGAAACAIGNLIQDLIWGGYGWTSVLGMIGNFLAAYIPFKMWQAIAGDEVNAHTWGRIGLFVWTGVVSCMATGFVLGFGGKFFFRLAFPELTYMVFINNFLFSMAFGLPAFILATINDPLGSSYVLPIRSSCGLGIFRNLSGHEIWFYIADTILLCACCFISVFTGISWYNSFVTRILIILTAAAILVTCMIPKKETMDRPKSAQ